jgi:hypothetical protein
MRLASPCHVSTVALLGAVTITLRAPVRAADPPSLKEAFQGSFLVGTAINRGITAGTGSRWRSQEQLDADIGECVREPAP